MSVKAIVLRSAGSNCDAETVRALDMAGADTDLVHIRALAEDVSALGESSILCLPGGFTFGDMVGAGRIMALELRTLLGDALRDFKDRDGLIVGICNGFQVLVQTGLLPGWDDDTRLALTLNASARFESRWIRLAIEEGTACRFVAPDGADPAGVWEMPVAHGEGQLVAPEGAVDRLESQGQVVFRFCGADGAPTDEYPANPNGTPGGITGLCDPTGRILGMMPHPERHVSFHQHPAWTRRGEEREGIGLSLFRGMVDAAR